MAEVAEVDLAWASGLIEGEGCFTLHSKYHPYFLLDMTDKDVVEKFHGIFPNTNFRGPYIHQSRPKYKPRYRVDAFGPSCLEIMEAVYPFMGQRRKAKIDELRGIYNNRSN